MSSVMMPCCGTNISSTRLLKCILEAKRKGAFVTCPNMDPQPCNTPLDAEVMAEAYKAGNISVIPCLTPGCPENYVTPPLDELRPCRHCKRAWCFNCSCPWHYKYDDCPVALRAAEAYEGMLARVTCCFKCGMQGQGDSCAKCDVPLGPSELMRELIEARQGKPEERFPGGCLSCQQPLANHGGMECINCPKGTFVVCWQCLRASATGKQRLTGAPALHYDDHVFVVMGSDEPTPVTPIAGARTLPGREPEPQAPPSGILKKRNSTTMAELASCGHGAAAAVITALFSVDCFDDAMLGQRAGEAGTLLRDVIVPHVRKNRGAVPPEACDCLVEKLGIGIDSETAPFLATLCQSTNAPAAIRPASFEVPGGTRSTTLHTVLREQETPHFEMNKPFTVVARRSPGDSAVVPTAYTGNHTLAAIVCAPGGLQYGHSTFARCPDGRWLATGADGSLHRVDGVLIEALATATDAVASLWARALAAGIEDAVGQEQAGRGAWAVALHAARYGCAYVYVPGGAPPEDSAGNMMLKHFEGATPSAPMVDILLRALKEKTGDWEAAHRSLIS